MYSESRKRKFERFLKSEDLKLTSEREMILDQVFSIHDHFEAEDILLRLRQRGQRVSKATIYRTLPLLVQSGLLREVLFNEKHSHYEHILGHAHHDHLICIACGKIIEFTEETIEELQRKLCDNYHFKPIRHKFEIVGYCEACAQADEAYGRN